MKEIEHIYYWDKDKNKPRIIQFTDATIAFYTPDTVLSQFIQNNERIPFYKNGQMKRFTFQDGDTEEYDAKGLLQKSYTEQPFYDPDIIQKHVCEYSYTGKGRFSSAGGIIIIVYPDGRHEEIGRIPLNRRDCPNKAKMIPTHYQEVLRFLQELPYTDKNQAQIGANYINNYAKKKVSRKQKPFPLEQKSSVKVRD